VKTAVDEQRRPGRWLLSGSQVFPLMHGVSESLAGRVAVLTLLPLSVAELVGAVRSGRPRDPIPKAWIDGNVAPRRKIPLARWLWRGSYPETWFGRKVDQQLWAASYLNTCIERDVRSLLSVRDLGTFQVFLRLLAARTGQILNLSDLARDAGITHTTARAWLNVLEASHQIFLLRPHHENLGKRLIKAPKAYWLDTVKAFHHRGVTSHQWFWRSRDGWEIDLLVERSGLLHPIEIKLSATPRPLHAETIVKWRAAAKCEGVPGFVVCDIDRPEPLVKGVTAMPWDSL
jgi:predicted AAA+ superfamily ATPase